MPGEIDWAALLEGEEPTPDDPYDISGLISIDSDISISGSTATALTRTPTPTDTRDRSHSISERHSYSFMNLQSVNDLLGPVLSPSPELHATKSASSIKSNVTFSEYEPEVFNLAEEINLLSIGDLLPEEQLEGEETFNESKYYSSDKFTEAYSESDEGDVTAAPSVIEEEQETEVYSEDDDISEEIKTKSDGWKSVKERMLNKGKKIPVFMVGPKKKKLQRDLSFSRSMDKTELSQLVSGKTSKTSIISEVNTRKSCDVSEKSPTKTYNYSSFTEDVTTISDSSELETVTKSRTSLTEIRFEPPCCGCKCKNQRADMNMRPIPLFSGMTLDSKTLEELSAMNPDKIALLNMMKAQYNLTRGLIDITSNILNSEIDNCKPTSRYTTYEETKEYIKKHQPYGRKERKRSDKRFKNIVISGKSSESAAVPKRTKPRKSKSKG